jgi:hypothetical protein
MKNKYRYTILLSEPTIDKLASFMENTDVKIVQKFYIEVTSDLDYKEKKQELINKVGTTTPDGLYEFVGFEDLEQIITN